MIVIKAHSKERMQSWFDIFEREMPDTKVVLWPDYDDPANVEFVIASELPPGEFAKFVNLKFVASMAVGVERLLGDKTMPAHLPIVRSVNPARGDTMTEYVVLHTLRYVRRLTDYQAHQAERRWQRLADHAAADTGVGVMGLGNLGLMAAERLRLFGFPVAGWVRNARAIDGIETFSGKSGFYDFLARSKIVVCLLPLTAETRDILDASAFAAMPQGSYLINAGRGEQVVDADLIAALDSGQLAGATLDVFRAEPLPPDHPFWRHPKITMTPHNAAATRQAHGADIVLENIRRARAGQPLVNLVDKVAGY